MTSEDKFHGVVCCCIDHDTSMKGKFEKLLNLNTTSKHYDIDCLDLELNNKYYNAIVHLFDSACLDGDNIDSAQVLTHCHAIILYGNGCKMTNEQLDSKIEQFKSVGGEPRLLLYDGIEMSEESLKSLKEWSINNEYNFVDLHDKDVREQLIDTLSVYKWPHRSNFSCPQSKPELNDEFKKKLVDFDNLLTKFNAYRDRPELRGNPDDKNIIEIAEILSNLLGDDVDGLLENGDEEEEEAKD